MPKIRVKAGKPNHQGAYSQGRKLGKARNHTHMWVRVHQFNKTIEYCRVPTCKAHHIVEMIS